MAWPNWRQDLMALPGSSNRNKGKLWDDAVSLALQKRGITRLEALAEIYEGMAAKASKGDLAAMLAILDRELGKPNQPVEQTIEANVTFDLAVEAAEQLRKKIRGEAA